MRRNRSYGRGGYSHYRGRSPLSTALRTTAVLLAVVLVLSVAALFFLEPYWVYSADGGRLHLPWVQEPEETASVPLPTVSQPLVVFTPEPAAETTLHAVSASPVRPLRRHGPDPYRPGGRQCRPF